MKVLLYGSQGWIGGKFAEYLQESNIDIICAKARADNEKDVEDELLAYKPTHVVSFIGRTHGEGINSIDYLEKAGKLPENIRDNLYAPLVLAVLCQKYNIHYTYLGTGCIFTGDGDYNEDAKPTFFGSSYSIVKGYTDRIMHIYPDVLNLRIRMPISSDIHPRNFITKILSYEKICSVPNSMTVLDDMMPIILDMMITKRRGTFNMCNKGIISHNEILEMYRELVDPTMTWQNMSLEEQDAILKAKRSNVQLDTNKLYTIYPNIPDIHTSVRECIIAMRK